MNAQLEAEDAAVKRQGLLEIADFQRHVIDADQPRLRPFFHALHSASLRQRWAARGVP
jgi:hypothetical protein